MTTDEMFNATKNAIGQIREHWDENFNGVVNKVAELEKDIKRVAGETDARLDTLALNGIGNTGASNRGPSDGDVRAFANAIQRTNYTAADVATYDKALNTLWRKGPTGCGAEILNTLSVGSDQAGGYLVTPDRTGRVVQKMYDLSPMRRLASVQSISTDALEGLIDNDEAESGWVTELGTRDDTDNPEIGKWRVPLWEQYAMPQATQQILDDAEIDIGAWLERKIAEKLARVEGAAFVSGNGSTQPRGFLDHSKATTDDATRAWGVIQYIATGTSGAFDSTAPADKLKDVTYALKAQYLTNARWLMRRSTAGVVSKMKDLEGRYIWGDSVAAGTPPTLCGYPVEFDENMPAIGASTYAIAFGDFAAAYQIVDHKVGLRVLRDPYTTKGRVKFYATKRTGGGLINSEAIKLLRFATS